MTVFTMFDIRVSGVLLPVFSLPGENGIGTFGKSALILLISLETADRDIGRFYPCVPPDTEILLIRVFVPLPAIRFS